MSRGFFEVGVVGVSALGTQVCSKALSGAGGCCFILREAVPQRLFVVEIIFVAAVVAGPCGVALTATGWGGDFFGGVVVLTLSVLRAGGEKRKRRKKQNKSEYFSHLYLLFIAYFFFESDRMITAEIIAAKPITSSDVKLLPIHRAENTAAATGSILQATLAFTVPARSTPIR